MFNKVDDCINKSSFIDAYKNVLNNLKKLGKQFKKIILDMNTISIDDKIMFKNEINGLNIDMLIPCSGTGAQAWEAI